MVIQWWLTDVISTSLEEQVLIILCCAQRDNYGNSLSRIFDKKKIRERNGFDR